MFKYVEEKVYQLLAKYVKLIEKEIPYEIYIAGGGDCPYVWIEVVIEKPINDDWKTIDFFIDEDTGKLYYGNEQINDIVFLEKKKTKKAVKEFMLKMIEEKK